MTLIPTRAGLQQRSQLLASTREFFADRGVLEVLTSPLQSTTVTDPQLDSFVCAWSAPGPDLPTQLYLQTSPEYAMKKLLALGSGDIYQLSFSHRDGEYGRWHTPAFLMLEWYRLNYTLADLIQEVDRYLQIIARAPAANIRTYGELFQQYCQINPHTAALQDLQQILTQHDVVLHDQQVLTNRDWVLQLIMSDVIERELASLAQPTIVREFPASQAALAQRVKNAEGVEVALRFEVYWQGVELANGYEELTCAVEQRRRFQQDLAQRNVLGKASIVPDEKLLQAMTTPGLPACAGVALGFDRLCALTLGRSDISGFYPL